MVFKNIIFERGLEDWVYIAMCRTGEPLLIHPRYQSNCKTNEAETREEIIEKIINCCFKSADYKNVELVCAELTKGCNLWNLNWIRKGRWADRNSGRCLERVARGDSGSRYDANI